QRRYLEDARKTRRWYGVVHRPSVTRPSHIQGIRPERVEHSERAADRVPRKIIPSPAICVFCVHLLDICVSSFSSRCREPLVAEVLKNLRGETTGRQSQVDAPEPTATTGSNEAAADAKSLKPRFAAS
ncbi:MAG TPA: hypothetical protein VIG49_12800, partial [Acetobacteraceae bacterium]